MSFNCTTCGDETCEHHGTSEPGCGEWTAETINDPKPESVPQPERILSCDCHAGFELRLCELEDLVSRMRREMTRGREL